MEMASITNQPPRGQNDYPEEEPDEQFHTGQNTAPIEILLSEDYRKMNIPFFSQKKPLGRIDTDIQPSSSPSSPSVVQSPIRRKPLPPGASPVILDSPSVRNSLRLLANNSISKKGSESPGSDFDLQPRDLDRYPHGETPLLNQDEHAFVNLDAPLKGLHIQVPRPSPLRDTVPRSPGHGRFASESHSIKPQNSFKNNLLKPERPLSEMSFSSSPTMATLSIPQNGGRNDGNYDEPPKSPGGFKSFFRWQSTSSQGSGPPPEPASPKLSPRSLHPSKPIPSALDIPKANAINYYGADSALGLPPVTPSTVEAIEEEVRIVSADLAASIRREMDLEDLVERLQMEAQLAGSKERRTSDYYSDAGTPARSLDGLSDKDVMDLEKLQRKAEQEKAQIRMEMLAKVSDERQRRKAMEQHVRELEHKMAKGDISPSTNERVRELEAQLEEARRKLSEERKVKENFEDLLVALRQDIEAHRNERDNLRDEVVPQLQARVEGLENEAAELQKLTYEHTKMQQEIMNLRNENAMLASTHRQITEMRNQMDRQSKRASIAVLTGTPSIVVSGVTTPTATTSKEGNSLADKLKDVEEQRDALHKALKSLRERQEYESRKAQERIRALELERDRALDGVSGRHNREVKSLRHEVNRLKHRAEEALEAKFVCERGLGTLKMDLERAEQETASLRALLRGHDALLSQHEELQKAHEELSIEVSLLRQQLGDEAASASLQKAYNDLQRLHDMTLVRLEQLESKGSELNEDLQERQRQLMNAHDESDKVISKLKQDVANAEAARDAAYIEAEAYRKRAEALASSEAQLLEEERSLANQLRSSAVRVEELAAQVRIQMDANNELRRRLADAIARGEEEQTTAAARINEFQNKLKRMEEKVLAAQQENEEMINRHEDEIRQMKESHSSQLRRLKSTVTSTQVSPKLPLSPMLLRSPLRSPKARWSLVSGGRRASLSNQTKMESLEKRVLELENALSDADREMEEVVEKINMAQMEVLQLQNQRDEAERQTRRLQAEVAAERAKNLGLLAGQN